MLPTDVPLAVGHEFSQSAKTLADLPLAHALVTQEPLNLLEMIRQKTFTLLLRWIEQPCLFTFDTPDDMAEHHQAHVLSMASGIRSRRS